MMVIARFLLWLARHVMPARLEHWVSAMRAELDAIDAPHAALGFAFGCLGCALREAMTAQATEWQTGATRHRTTQGTMGIEMPDLREMWNGPRRRVAMCAVAATMLGLSYMTLAGAPTRYLLVNAAALAIGLGLAALLSRRSWASGALVTLMLATGLLATALFGISVNGATRWVPIGGLVLQPALIVLPLIASGFARSRGWLGLAGVAVAALALAIQPDRGGAGALAAGMAALVMLRPTRSVVIAFALSAFAFGATMLRVDVQPAMPYVDRIVYTAFSSGLLPGAAVLVGLALLLLPVAPTLARRTAGDEPVLVFGAVWTALIAAAVFGNYPTPLVGYGGSAILGYVIALLSFPPTGVSVPAVRAADDSEDSEDRVLPRQAVAGLT